MRDINIDSDYGDIESSVTLNNRDLNLTVLGKFNKYEI